MYNKILWVSILACAVAQILKVIISIIINRKLDFKLLASTGGMPSSHSALVCSLTTSVARVCGINSVEFDICAVFSIIVMYDSAGIRRAAGEQAKVLNKIMALWEEEHKLSEKYLKEFLGHTPIQVFVGMLLGIAVALFFF